MNIDEKKIPSPVLAAAAAALPPRPLQRVQSAVEVLEAQGPLTPQRAQSDICVRLVEQCPSPLFRLARVTAACAKTILDGQALSEEELLAKAALLPSSELQKLPDPLLMSLHDLFAQILKKKKEDPSPLSLKEAYSGAFSKDITLADLQLLDDPTLQAIYEIFVKILTPASVDSLA